MPRQFPFITKKRLIPAVKRLAVARSAKAAQAHFLNSFKKQGFTDATLRLWEKQKRPTGRGILIGKQARLKKSIKIRRITRNSALIATSGVKYARIQNEGGTTHPTVTDEMRAFAWAKFRETGAPHWKALALTKKDKLTVKIPERKFVDRSKELDRATCRIIAREFLKIFT